MCFGKCVFGLKQKLFESYAFIFFFSTIALSFGFCHCILSKKIHMVGIMCNTIWISNEKKMNKKNQGRKNCHHRISCNANFTVVFFVFTPKLVALKRKDQNQRYIVVFSILFHLCMHIFSLFSSYVFLLKQNGTKRSDSTGKQQTSH